MSGRPSGTTASSTRGHGIYVIEIRDGRLTSMCEFDLEDEEAAFAYAEERMRATTSRLALTNRASESVHAFATARPGPRRRGHVRLLLGPVRL